MTLEAGTHIGKYVVRRKLAEGGMAEIYLCTARGAEGFEKEVVIKRVRAFLASDPEFVGMFIAEARLASRLNHANVVQIFDFDKHEDTYYLAMEYVRGCSLWELRRKCKELMTPVPPVLVAHLGAEVARGLHYAHRVQVNGQPLDLVHRDVTPHNVLLSFDGAVKLTDFGIAKAGNRLTQPGVLKGKFAYMAPEQARGEAVDARTDLFALGVVLWELLTGGRLFDGDSEVAVLRAVQQSAIAPPARLNPDVPADLDAIVVRALERDPAARFQTAGELERALAQCVLKHATSVDDTDLGAFLRRLFPASTTQALPTVQERTHVEPVPVPPGDDAPAPAPREPTVVMPRASRGRGLAVTPSPDEDVSASTFVLPRRDEEPAPVPPLLATPLMPLPAVASAAMPLPPPSATPGAPARPSRPEGTPAVVPPEAGEGSGRGAHPGMPSVVGTAASSASRPASERPATVEVDSGARVKPASRRRPLLLGLTAALGLAGVLGGVAVTRLRSEPVATPAPIPPAPAVAAESAGGPGTPVAAPAAGGSEAALAAPAPSRGGEDPGAEVDGLKREEALGGTAPAPGDSRPAASDAREARPAASTGTLQVQAAPYATVFLNGKKLGEVVGRASYKLAPGTYKLLFQHPAGDKRFDVTIAAGTSVTREFRAPRAR
jgi:serine/threonine-protein kinase